MGGASTQIAFTPQTDIMAEHFPVLLGGRRYRLYVHSYLYYGANAVSERVDRLVVADSHTSPTVNHPCMLRGNAPTLHSFDLLQIRCRFVVLYNLSICLQQTHSKSNQWSLSLISSLLE